MTFQHAIYLENSTVLLFLYLISPNLFSFFALSKMTQNYRVMSLSIFVLFFLPRDSLSFDYYKACKPKCCGDLTIRYPFYIKGEQESICGYPGFEVSCLRNLLFMNLSSDEYMIKNISYEHQTVSLVNTALVGVLDCSVVGHNLTLRGTKFKFAGNYINGYLMENCTAEAKKSMVQLKEIWCKNRSVSSNLLVAHATDMTLSKVVGKCSRVVLVPYEERQEDGDIQSDMLKGLLLRWNVSNCPDSCGETNGRCGYNVTSSRSLCFCPDGPQPDRCHLTKKNVGLIAGLSVAGGAIMLTLASIAYWYRKKLKFNHSQFVSRSNSLDRAASDIEKGSIYFGVPLFSYSELEEATDNFNHCRELGDGGFGTVYYGKLKDGREVAVKRLFEKSYKRVEQFMNEVQILTCLRHQNLVSLYGCTSHHSRELLLVYEFVPNGTVADHLYGEIAKSRSLPWHVRMRIAIETASALLYLHASDIIHRDVKTNNILLDSSFSVKVADFGLSRLFPNDVTHVSTAPQGTPGYLDPEYHQCYQLTDKSDVYSYGVVLIELISSLPAVDMDRHRQEINLSNYAMNRIQRCAFDELVDPKLGFTSDFKVRKMTTAVAELAFQCLQPDKEFRPSMDEVLVNLKRIESADYEALKAEKAIKNDGIGGSSTPPPSPTENDDAKLLTNHQANPCSPNSVMDKWGSKNTTPNTSK